MANHVFRQVDVFTAVAFKGNPLAVVTRADHLSERQMAAIANWMNLSETTFLSAPTHADADYKVRIFTPERELAFAGHPTLGSCHVWLEMGGAAKSDPIVQECGAGLIRIKRENGRLAFAAPPLRRSGDVALDLVHRVARGLRIAPGAITASQWVDNGPGWLAAMLSTKAEVLALRPDFPLLDGQPLGVVAPWDAARDGSEAHFEVRAFITTRAAEDPVTGSLNAGLAQWLISAGLAPDAYVVSQGTQLGRAGRVHVARSGDAIWIGGDTVTCIEGTISV
jgi:PhzF family phenazine biosynthesis protein